MQQYSKTYINLYPNYNLHIIVYISYKKEDKFEILFNRSDSTVYNKELHDFIS